MAVKSLLNINLNPPNKAHRLRRIHKACGQMVEEHIPVKSETAKIIAIIHRELQTYEAKHGIPTSKLIKALQNKEN